MERTLQQRARIYNRDTNITSLDLLPPVLGNSMEVLRELVRSVVREELQKQRLDQNAPMLSSLADVIREEVRQVSRMAVQKPIVSGVNKQKRLGFAREHLQWTEEHWAKVVFTDESSFTTRWDQRLWRPQNCRYMPEYMQRVAASGRSAVSVWGAVTAQGLGPLVRIEGRFTADAYCGLLDDALLPYLEAAPNLAHQYSLHPLWEQNLVFVGTKEECAPHILLSLKELRLTDRTINVQAYLRATDNKGKGVIRLANAFTTDYILENTTSPNNPIIGARTLGSTNVVKQHLNTAICQGSSSSSTKPP
ncbi:hypothetical protein MTO96_049214 [Rhipicephalus appendiculatus]